MGKYNTRHFWQCGRTFYVTTYEIVSLNVQMANQFNKKKVLLFMDTAFYRHFIRWCSFIFHANPKKCIENRFLLLCFVPNNELLQTNWLIAYTSICASLPWIIWRMIKVQNLKKEWEISVWIETPSLVIAIQLIVLLRGEWIVCERLKH